jgi:hypothetical protein
MKFDEKHSVDVDEAELEPVLRDFRQSVHAWSEAKYGRSNSLAPATLHHTWRRAMAWALGCVLAIGGLSAGVYERYHQSESAKSNSVQHSTQQQVTTVAESTAPAEKARAGEARVQEVAQVDASEPDGSLLASVDSDVSRQVPSAMEPLAQLMESNSIH